MTSYKKLFTDYGQDKITDAVCDEGEVKISKMVIGDGNGALYEPLKTQTELVNQLDILDITDFEKNGNVCRFFAEIPSNTDYYIIREIGLIDDENKLIWVSQFEMETVSNIDNVVTENIIGIQLEFEQGVTVSLVDTSVLTASKDYVDNTFQKLSEKGKAFGYCPLDENIKISENYLPDSFANQNLSNLTENGYLQTNIFPASVISGNYSNMDGYPDLISNSGSTCSFKVSDITGDYQPLRVSFCDNKIEKFLTLQDLDVSELSDGTYNLFLDKNGTVHPFKNNYYASRITPGNGTTTIEYVTRTSTSTTNVYQKDSNLTVVGSLSITNSGLVSGFSTSNYIASVSNASNFISASNWEIFVRFKLTSATGSQVIFGHYRDGSTAGVYTYYGCNIFVNSNKKLQVLVNQSLLNVTDTNDIVVNTWYEIKVTKNSSGYFVTGSLSGSSTSSSTTNWANHPVYFGFRKGGGLNTPSLAGPDVVVDLYNSYIKSNDTYVVKNSTTQTITTTYQEKVVSTTGSSLSENDIWLDTSLKNYVTRQYDGTLSWNTVDYVRLPHQIEISSGNISQIKTVCPFNANGWDEQLSTPDMNRQTTLTKGSSFTAPYSGWVYNYTVGDTYYLEKGSSYTPLSGSSGTWYYSPIKGC